MSREERNICVPYVNLYAVWTRAPVHTVQTAYMTGSMRYGSIDRVMRLWFLWQQHVFGNSHKVDIDDDILMVDFGCFIRQKSEFYLSDVFLFFTVIYLTPCSRSHTLLGRRSSNKVKKLYMNE